MKMNRSFLRELDDAFIFGVVVVGIAGFMLCACPDKPPNPPPVDRDASAPATCGDVCTHYRELGCKQGNPTPKGASCETVCENYQTSGIAKWNLACRVGVKSCESLDDCERPTK